MNTFGLNGTWLPYHAPLGTEPALNLCLLDEVKAQGITQIAVCSNQGEIAYGREHAEQGRPLRFPAVADLAANLAFVCNSLSDAGIAVASVHISLFHPAVANAVWIGRCCAELSAICHAAGIPVTCYPSTWKPQPQMLLRAFADCLWGSNPHDAQAACAANIPYRAVPRFEL